MLVTTHCNGSARLLSSSVFNNTASLGPTVVPRDNVSPQDITSLCHVILEVAPGDRPGEVSNINTSSSVIDITVYSRTSGLGCLEAFVVEVVSNEVKNDETK